MNLELKDRRESGSYLAVDCRNTTEKISVALHFYTINWSENDANKAAMVHFGIPSHGRCHCLLLSSRPFSWSLPSRPPGFLLSLFIWFLTVSYFPHLIFVKLVYDFGLIISWRTILVLWKPGFLVLNPSIVIPMFRYC